MSSVAPAPVPGAAKPMIRGTNMNNPAAAAAAAPKQAVTPTRRSESFPRSSDHVAVTPSLDDPAMTALLNSIASKQSCLMPPTCLTLTMYIPTNSVGAVIGRKGQAISQLQIWASRQATTHQPVRISVMGIMAQNNSQSHHHHGVDTTTGTASSNTADSTTATPTTTTTTSIPPTYTPLDMSSRDWTPLVIRADPKACLAAALHIYQTVECDDVVLDVPVARTKHAGVVGKRGILLATASADYNVRIMVPSKQQPPAMTTNTNTQFQHHNIIQLEGDLKQVIYCLDRIMGVAVKTHRKSAAATETSESSDAAAAEVPSQVVILHAMPPQTRLRTIRRNTETMFQKKRLGAATSAAEPVMVDADDDDDEEAADTNHATGTAASWEVIVSGNTIESVQRAVELLKAAAAEEPQISQSRRSERRRKGNNRRKTTGAPK